MHFRTPGELRGNQPIRGAANGFGPVAARALETLLKDCDMDRTNGGCDREPTREPKATEERLRLALDRLQRAVEEPFAGRRQQHSSAATLPLATSQG